MRTNAIRDDVCIYIDKLSVEQKCPSGHGPFFRNSGVGRGCQFGMARPTGSGNRIRVKAYHR